MVGVTTDGSSKLEKGEVVLTTDGTSAATRFTKHYRSALKSQAP